MDADGIGERTNDDVWLNMDPVLVNYSASDNRWWRARELVVELPASRALLLDRADGTLTHRKIQFLMFNSHCLFVHVPSFSL
jgi:hypothetical protein